MSELKPDKELCELAKIKVKKLSEDESYNKYQIGEISDYLLMKNFL